jgi:hypothetical protein
MTPALGLIPEKEDRRDFLMAYYLPRMTIPVKVDFSDVMGPARDQGEEGVCEGMAAAAMKEWQEQAEWLKFIRLSPRYVYQGAKAIDDFPGEEGTTLRDVMKVLHERGICTEARWPYVSHLPGTPDPDADREAEIYRILSYARLFTPDEMRRSIAVNGPFCLGLMVTEEWMDAGSDGVIEDPRPSSRVLGGHATCCCGYDRRDSLFLIRNSWGEGWGRGGYGWISQRALEDRLISAWSAVDFIVRLPKIIED